MPVGGGLVRLADPQHQRGKYARNEICRLLPVFASTAPGKENSTVTPIRGDLCWFSFDSDDLGNPAYGYENSTGTGTTGAIC